MKPDGGYAFPYAYVTDLPDRFKGMTLRDYFAAQAMPVLIDRFLYIHEVTARAYEVADAMIAEKEKP